MKITFFIKPSLRNYGGLEKWIIDMGNKLVEKGYDILVISSGEALDERISMKDLESMIKFKYKEINVPKIKFKGYVVERLIKTDSDVLYIGNLYNSTFFPFLFKKKNQKLIFGNHSLFFILKEQKIKSFAFGLLAKIYFHKIKNVKIHVLNSEQYKWYRSLGFKEVYLIPNFVNSKEYLYPKNNDEFIVLFLARIDKQKGIDLLPEIIKKVLSKNKEIKFYIAGSGNKYYENLIRKLENRYPNNVKYFGFIDENTKKELLSKSSLFLLPSRFETGVPTLSIGEALVSGTPFLGSNIVSFRDLINIYDKKFGWIVDNYNPESFANKILEIYNY